MKRLAFLSFTIATLIAPIQVQAQTGCVAFPQRPNPEAELRYLLSHPGAVVCPSGQSADGGDGASAEIGRRLRNADQLRGFNAWFYGAH